MGSTSPTSSSFFPPQVLINSYRSGNGHSQQKCNKFNNLLKTAQVDVTALREALWSGAPDDDPTLRGDAWKLTLGYIPARRDRHDEIICRKRKEYLSLSTEYQFALDDTYSDSTTSLIRQIRVDIPRTCLNGVDALADDRIRTRMERVLFIWASRNPACGYVQGMNDLTVPLWIVLLQSKRSVPTLDLSVPSFSDDELDLVEADLYWMFSKLLQDLQDNYIFSQPGIQRMNLKLKEIVQRLDPELAWHLASEQVDFMHISFRWFNCLLTREFRMPSLLRIWDTCIAEMNGFSVFMVYFCAVVLIKLSSELKRSDFQGIVLIMSQGKQTSNFDVETVETLLSEAFVMKSLFHSSPSHLQPSS